MSSENKELLELDLEFPINKVCLFNVCHPSAGPMNGKKISKLHFSDTKGKMEDYKASQRYRIPVKNVMGDKKTHIMKRLKKKDLKRRLDARVKKKGK